jgi:hypothetical protein
MIPVSSMPRTPRSSATSTTSSARWSPLAGAEHAVEFGDRWEQHTQSLFQYAQAARGDDETAREQAGTALATDVDDLLAILEDLTDGNLARPAAREALESMPNC